MTDAYKELTPVIYGNSGIKLLKFQIQAGQMCFSAHWHDRMELLQLISGKLEVRLNDMSFTARAGDTILITPHMIHCGFAGEEAVQYYAVSFEPEKFLNHTVACEKYLPPIMENTTGFCPVAHQPEITQVMTDIIRYLSSDKPYASLCAIGKIYELTGLLYHHCAVSCAQLRRPDQKFGAVLSYVNNHYTEEISSKNISRKFGYEETYFCRRFKEATGISAMKYIRLLRLEKAQRLLAESKKEILEISILCGFSDISYFSNCFKKQFGMSPTDFRRTIE